MVKMLCVWFDLKTQFARLLLSATWERKAKRANQKQRNRERKRKEKLEHEYALLSCHTNRIESANACRTFYGTMIVNFALSFQLHGAMVDFMILVLDMKITSAIAICWWIATDGVFALRYAENDCTNCMHTKNTLFSISLNALANCFVVFVNFTLP